MDENMSYTISSQELMCVMIPKQVVMDMVKAQAPPPAPPPVPPPVPPPAPLPPPVPPVQETHKVKVTYPNDADFVQKSIVHNTLIRAGSYDTMFRAISKSFNEIVVTQCLHQIEDYIRKSGHDTSRGHATFYFRNTTTNERTSCLHLYMTQVLMSYGEFQWLYDGISWNFVENDTRNKPPNKEVFYG